MMRTMGDGMEGLWMDGERDRGQTVYCAGATATSIVCWDGGSVNAHDERIRSGAIEKKKERQQLDLMTGRNVRIAEEDAETRT